MIRESSSGADLSRIWPRQQPSEACRNRLDPSLKDTHNAHTILPSRVVTAGPTAGIGCSVLNPSSALLDHDDPHMRSRESQQRLRDSNPPPYPSNFCKKP